jgi:hypothetical protein
MAICFRDRIEAELSTQAPIASAFVPKNSRCDGFLVNLITCSDDSDRNRVRDQRDASWRPLGKRKNVGRKVMS